MSNNEKWPEHQKQAPVNLWAERNTQVPERFGLWAATSIEPDADLPLVKYTRTDIAEARIAELEAERNSLRVMLKEKHDWNTDLLAENARLQEQLHAGTEAGWHALRNERDALRSRIEDAPTLSVIGHEHLVAGEQITGIHDEKTFPDLAGKRIALVRLDDE